jgi:Zn-dependent protease
MRTDVGDRGEQAVRPDGLPAYHPEPYKPKPGPERRPSLPRRVGGAIAAAIALLAKFAAKFKLLLVALPKIKLLTTSGTMLVSVAAYALLWPWQVAVGLVLLLLVHELGHAIQLKREGVEAGWPVFIPLMGAFIGMKRLPDDAGAEARVGLAGPVLGSLGALVPLAIYGATGSELFRALAFLGFFINLINLVPVLPLDGGRAMAALSPWMWLVGFAMLIGIGIAFPSPIVLFVIVFGGFELYRRFKARKSPESQAYFKVPAATRAGVALVYLLLAAALFVGMHETHLVRHL